MQNYDMSDLQDILFVTACENRPVRTVQICYIKCVVLLNH